MDADDIIYKLKKAGYRQSDLARICHVSRPAVNMIIYNRGTSRRIRQTIADIIGIDVDEIWPENAA